MISRQMVATFASLSGPGFAACSPLITWASRSGRNTVEPSARLSSPTSLASAARRLRASSSSRSTASISMRSWPRSFFMSLTKSSARSHGAPSTIQTIPSSGFLLVGAVRLLFALDGLGIILHDALQAAELGAFVEPDQRDTLGGAAQLADLANAGAYQHALVG